MVDIFDCARAQIYHNTGKLTPAQIKAKTGCTHIINGYLFNSKFQPVGWTVIDGKVISRDKYQDWGVSISSDGVPKMLTGRRPDPQGRLQALPGPDRRRGPACCPDGGGLDAQRQGMPVVRQDQPDP